MDAVTPQPARPLYFINAPTDYACIGGLSIALYAALALLQRGAHITPPAAQWSAAAAAFTWLCNWPHFAATSYRLYHSKRNIAQYPVTAAVIPLLMLAAIVASLASPDGVAPYFVKLYLIWSPYHYSGQSLGISLLYARRAGVRIGRLERLALSGFIFGTFLLPSSRAEVGADVRTFYGISYPMLRLPSAVPAILAAVMWTCGAAFLVLILSRAARTRRLPPPIVLLPAVTQLVWFEVGARIPSFNEFVPFFHGLQYLLIAWAMQLKEQMDEHHVAPSPRYALTESLRWGAVILLGGAALFWVLPRVGLLAGFSLSIAEPVIIAAVQIHHFFVDGVIWKLKNPRVSSPLLVNLEQLTRATPSSLAEPS